MRELIEEAAAAMSDELGELIPRRRTKNWRDAYEVSYRIAPVSLLR